MIKKQNKSSILHKMLIRGFIALSIAIFFETYLELIEVKINRQMVQEILLGVNWVRCFLVFIVLFFVLFYYLENQEKWNRFLFTYRFHIAAGVFILCVLLRVHGSSMLEMNNHLKSVGFSVEEQQSLLGVRRPIRSDEWAVNTPMILSQANNLGESFPYISETMRGTATDAFIVYGQPVRDIAVLFRPFHWGYLFLPIEMGFSFFWCGRLIALFLITFELGRVLTKDKRALALSLAFLVTFSSGLQWWVAINGFVEILVFGQLAVLLAYWYMRDTRYRNRIIYAILLGIAGGGYILVFYPSWQVPFIYTFLPIGLWVIIDNMKNFRFNWKKDIPTIGLTFGVLIGGMGYILSKSWNTVSTVLNTAYPGVRAETGKGPFLRLFQYPDSIFLPLQDLGLSNTNVCEMATFFDFFPLGIILGLVAIFIYKKRDVLLYLLLGFQGFLLFFYVLGVPSFVANISLLSQSQPIRAYMALGFLNLLILIRVLSYGIEFFTTKKRIIVSFLVAAGIGILSYNAYIPYLPKSRPITAVFTIALLFVGIFLIFSSCIKAGKYFLIFSVLIAFLTGMWVNPVEIGLAPYLENEAMNELSAINQEDPGMWIYDSPHREKSGASVLGNMMIANGLPTFSSIHTYPALELWEKLDTEKKFEPIYNRYAHVNTYIDNTQELNITSANPDVLAASLNHNNLETLGVKYTVSHRDLTEFNDEQITYEKIKTFNEIYVYELHYER